MLSKAVGITQKQREQAHVRWLNVCSSGQDIAMSGGTNLQNSDQHARSMRRTCPLRAVGLYVHANGVVAAGSGENRYRTSG